MEDSSAAGASAFTILYCRPAVLLSLHSLPRQVVLAGCWATGAGEAPQAPPRFRRWVPPHGMISHLRRLGCGQVIISHISRGRAWTRNHVSTRHYRGDHYAGPRGPFCTALAQCAHSAHLYAGFPVTTLKSPPLLTLSHPLPTSPNLYYPSTIPIPTLSHPLPPSPNLYYPSTIPLPTLSHPLPPSPNLYYSSTIPIPTLSYPLPILP